MPPTIIVLAHNRPEALDRLLRSLASAHAEPNSRLLISIDPGAANTAEVTAVANDFHWQHGPYEILAHAERFGLVEHFRWVGDQTGRFGKIVLLEDDLVVGPNAIRWADAALAHSADEPRSAGVCLSTPRFDGFRHHTFEPLHDGTDALWMKIMWFHGLAFTDAQWQRHLGGRKSSPNTSLPATFDTLGDDEWFPPAVRAMVEADLFCLAPRVAQAVNFGDAGVHFEAATETFQQPLATGLWHPPRFSNLEASTSAVYDVYMEHDRRWFSTLSPQLRACNPLLDLRAIRPRPENGDEWVITTRPTTSAMSSWGAPMHPLELNIVFDVPGDAIHLSRTRDIDWSEAGEAQALTMLERHARHGRPESRLQRGITRLTRALRR